MPSLGLITANIRMNFTSPETRVIVHDHIFIRLDKPLERNAQTDRRTDRNMVAITAVCIARKK